MSKYTINIGLANPFRGEDNSIEKTLVTAMQFLRGVTNVTIQESDSERTVVIDYNENRQSYSVLACALDQDCVAVLNNETGVGELFGDKAEAWAPFNPKYFLTNQ
jgi:hypothetical protein